MSDKRYRVFVFLVVTAFAVVAASLIVRLYSFDARVEEPHVAMWKEDRVTCWIVYQDKRKSLPSGISCLPDPEVWGNK